MALVPGSVRQVTQGGQSQEILPEAKKVEK